MILKKRIPKPPPKIGLALGSGSARGWAHIGVIQALTEAGIHVDCVAGTSVGAVVGAVYCSGKIRLLEDTVLHLDWKKIIYFFDVVFPKSGLIDGNKIADFIREHVQEESIENLPLPFCAVSTDLITGEEVAIQEGDIIEAIRASISIPGIFTPVRKNNMTMVDGGLVNPVPVSVVREMGADFVIAVDLNHYVVPKRGSKMASASRPENMVSYKATDKHYAGKSRILNALNKKVKTLEMPALTQLKQWMARDQMPTIFEVLVASITIMERQITATRMKTDPPDLLIKPKLGHLKLLEFHRAEEAIAAGYEEAKSSISSLIGKKG